MVTHKEKQRGCPLLEANKHTWWYISNMYIYIRVVLVFDIFEFLHGQGLIGFEINK